MIEKLRRNFLILGALLLAVVVLYIWPSLLWGGSAIASGVFAVFAGKYRAERDLLRKEVTSERDGHVETVCKMENMIRETRAHHQTSAMLHQFRIQEAMAIELELHADGMMSTAKTALISPRMVAAILYRRARFLRSTAPPPPPLPMSVFLGEPQETKGA